MNSGTMKTRGAEISASTFLTCGSCFQNASRTSRKIFRRRSSAACWKNRRGGLVVQCRAVAEHDQRGVGKIFALHAHKLAASRAPSASRLMQIFIETF